MVSVYSRAHRSLKSLEGFKIYNSEDGGFFNESLPEFGEVIGLYEQPSGGGGDTLVITEKGILLRASDGWDKTEFAEIDGVSSPENKDNASKLSLKIRDGTTKTLNIEGGSGNFRDVYSFHRFILGVLSDLQR